MPGYATSIGQTLPVGTSASNGVRMAATTTSAPFPSTTKVVRGFTVAPTTTGRPKVYLAGAFTTKPLKVWTGSAWVEKPLKVWTGSAWKAVGGVSGGPIVYSDNFNRADTTTTSAGGAGLGAEWLGDSWRISSNTAMRDFGAVDFVVFQHDLGTLDMWAEADVTPNGAYGIVNVRDGATPATNCYMGFWNPATLNFEIGMNVSGGYSTLATGGTGNGLVKKLRLEAQGTAIRLYVDGVLTVSTTNGVINATDFPNNRYAGMNATTGPVYDNFRCGALPWTP